MDHEFQQKLEKIAQMLKDGFEMMHQHFGRIDEHLDRMGDCHAKPRNDRISLGTGERKNL